MLQEYTKEIEAKTTSSLFHLICDRYKVRTI